MERLTEETKRVMAGGALIVFAALGIASILLAISNYQRQRIIEGYQSMGYITAETDTMQREIILLQQADLLEAELALENALGCESAEDVRGCLIHLDTVYPAH